LFYRATGGDFTNGVFVYTGSGADAVYVVGTAANAPTQVVTGAGADSVIVSSLTGTLDTLFSHLGVDLGGGANGLSVSEAGRATGDAIALTGGEIFSALQPLAVFYQASGGTLGVGAYLTTGSGDDFVTVQGTAAGAPTAVRTGAGDDTVVVASA